MKIGQKVRDRVTDFTGIIVAHCTYISGCDQFQIQPEVSDNGFWIDPLWLDGARLEVVNSEPITLKKADNSNNLVLLKKDEDDEILPTIPQS